MFLDSHPLIHHLHLGILRSYTKLDLVSFGCSFEYVMYFEMDFFVLSKWSYKVEGAKTNTPPRTNTYEHLPIANTLLSLTVPHGVEVSNPTE
jgi:hypothetical protein